MEEDKPSQEEEQFDFQMENQQVNMLHRSNTV